MVEGHGQVRIGLLTAFMHCDWYGLRLVLCLNGMGMPHGPTHL